MSYLNRDRLMEYVESLKLMDFPAAASVTIYGGAAVTVDAEGDARPANSAAGKFAGIADGPADNSSGEEGDVTVKVLTPDGARWDASGMDQDNVGAAGYFSDDHTIVLTPTLCYAGVIRAVESATLVWVDHRGAYAGMTGIGASLTTPAPTTAH